MDVVCRLAEKREKSEQRSALTTFLRSAAKRLTAKSLWSDGLASLDVNSGAIPASPLITEHFGQQRSRHLQHLCTSCMALQRQFEGQVTLLRYEAAVLVPRNSTEEDRHYTSSSCTMHTLEQRVQNRLACGPTHNATEYYFRPGPKILLTN